MDITSDYESLIPGSSPGKGIKSICSKTMWVQSSRWELRPEMGSVMFLAETVYRIQVLLLECSSVVERSPDKREVVGSFPTFPTILTGCGIVVAHVLWEHEVEVRFLSL